jgi:chromosome segregation ATPase
MDDLTLKLIEINEKHSQANERLVGQITNQTNAIIKQTEAIDEIKGVIASIPAQFKEINDQAHISIQDIIAQSTKMYDLANQNIELSTEKLKLKEEQLVMKTKEQEKEEARNKQLMKWIAISVAISFAVLSGIKLAEILKFI